MLNQKCVYGSLGIVGRSVRLSFLKACSLSGMGTRHRGRRHGRLPGKPTCAQRPEHTGGGIFCSVFPRFGAWELHFDVLGSRSGLTDVAMARRDGKEPLQEVVPGMPPATPPCACCILCCPQERGCPARGALMGSPLLFSPKITTSHPTNPLVHTTRAHPRLCAPRGAHRTWWLSHLLGDIPPREQGLSKKGLRPGARDAGPRGSGRDCARAERQLFWVSRGFRSPDNGHCCCRSGRDPA